MITTRIIDEQHKQDINIKNEPFRIWGRMIPSYIDEKWDYRIEKFHEEKIEEDCFPDEDYDYDAMKKEYFFVGAYDGEDCVGVALLRRHYFKYLYLDDLKVSKAYRGQKIGHLLIDHCKKVAKENGYRGVYTIGQDNNLSACLFYLNCGFSIGGLNTKVYTGTSQEGKEDIFFYVDC